MTMRRWCFKTVRRANCNKRLAIAVCLATFFFACVARRAQAGDSAPDWLRAAAQEKLADYPSSTKAVILLDETQITVQHNGEIYTRHRMAVRLLRPEARDEWDSVAVDFDKDTKVLSLNAWTIEPDGRVIAVGEKDAQIHGYLSDLAYADLKEMVLGFPDAYPGRVVGFESVQRDRPYVFEDDWWFQDQSPVRSARLILQIPSGWEFTTNWFNHPEVKPQTPAPNEYAWQVDDLPGVEIEPRMPPWRTVAGWMGLKYFPSDPALRAKSTGSWTDIGLWYDNLTKSRRDPTPEIQQKVSELTAGTNDTLQKIRLLTEYMQRNIRYFAIEIGIGGYQPHTAADVFAHQYGDCKDKATLLSAMLRAIGIESYYVIIDTHRGLVNSNYPSIDFNHVILAIKLPDTVNDPGLYSVIDDPKLGRLLIFDPTNEYVPLGYVPSYLQDSYALVVAPDGGHIEKIPLLPPSTNRLLRIGKLSLAADGNLSGEIQELRWGGPAADEREAFLEIEPSKREQIFDEFLAQSLNSFQLTGASLGNLDQYDKHSGSTISFSLPITPNRRAIC